jgi:hypothetical protein
MGSRRSFNHALQFCRRWYLGDEQRVIPSVSMTFFIRRITDIQWNRSDPLVHFGQPYRLFRHFRPTISPQ